MKRAILFHALFLIFAFSLIGAEVLPLHEQIKSSFDGNGNIHSKDLDFGYDIAIDSEGNSYITGSFSGHALFGNIELVAMGYNDAFIAKLDPNGHYIWVKSVRGQSSVEGIGIALSPEGHPYIIGVSNNPIHTMYFDSIELNQMGYFLAKLDKDNGNFLWARGAGERNVYMGLSAGISVDNYGNPYITGSFFNSLDLIDTQLTSHGLALFIAKFDANGNFLWANQAGGIAQSGSGSGDIICYSIALDHNGVPYITGSFRGTSAFGNIQLFSQRQTVFTAKINPADGDFIWAVNADNIAYTSVASYNITIDNSGNPLINGKFHGAGAVNFGSTQLHSENGYNFVSKLDSNGNFLWASNFDGDYGERGSTITADGFGNSYITGHFNDTASFGNLQLVSQGLDDIFIAKLGPDGNFLWAKQAGGNYQDIGVSISSNYYGDTFITGYFYGSANFGNINLISNGGYNAYIAKLDTNGNFLWAQKAGGHFMEDGPGYFKWAKNAGDKFGRALCIAVDNNGDSYVGGDILGDTLFGDSEISPDYENKGQGIITRLDSGGNFLWARKAGSQVYHNAIDNSGNIFITGGLNQDGNNHFGNIQLDALGTIDTFIARLRRNGNFLWAKNIGGINAHVYSHSIAVDNNGNSFLIGYWQGGDTIYFDDIALDSLGLYTVFIAKIDINGNFVWVRNIDLGGIAFFDWNTFGITADNYGNSYITGGFHETVVLDEIMLYNEHGVERIFIAKIDPEGNFLWANSDTSENGWSWGNTIDLDSEGNIYIGGDMFGDLEIDGNLFSNIAGAMVARFCPDGNLIWVQILDSLFSSILDIALDVDGYIYTSGQFRNPVNIMGYELIPYDMSGFYTRLDNNGNFLNVKAVYSINRIMPSGGIGVDNAGNAYISGSFHKQALLGNITLVSNNPDPDYANMYIGKLKFFGNEPDGSVYRFFNHIRGGHLYTLSPIERDYVLRLPEWNYEGISFNVHSEQISGTFPAYRFFNTMTGIHLYTISEYERDHIIDNLSEWNYEGISFYVFDTEAHDRIPVFRFFNHVRGGHLYTISEYERDYIIDNLPEWNYEGISFYVFSSL